MIHSGHFKRILLFALILLLIAGCGGGPTPTQVITETVAPEPTVTPTQTPPKALLIAPPEIESTILQTKFNELAVGSQLQAEIRPSLQPDELSSDIMMVIFLVAPQDLNPYLSAAPQAQFLVVSSTELPQAANLSVIRTRPEDQAFLSGYMSAILAPDWRAAALIPSGTPGADNFQLAYTNGFYYYCGVCTVVNTPMISFPQIVSLPAGSDSAAWQSAVDALRANFIFLAYIAPLAQSPELATGLAGGNLLLLGGQTPPDAVRARWAGTVQFDLLTPIITLWPDLAAGKGGAAISAPLVVVDVNLQILTEGRMRLVKEMADLLAKGKINTLNVP